MPYVISRLGSVQPLWLDYIFQFNEMTMILKVPNQITKLNRACFCQNFRSLFLFLWLNQTLHIFLLYVKKPWETMTAAISVWEIIFLWFEEILLLICMLIVGTPYFLGGEGGSEDFENFERSRGLEILES